MAKKKIHVQTARKPGALDPKKVVRSTQGGKKGFREHPHTFRELMRSKAPQVD